MIYGTTTLNVLAGSLATTKTVKKVIRSYINSDSADEEYLGREPTKFTCTLIAESDSARVLIESLLQSNTNLTLYFDNHYYKNVVGGASTTLKPATGDETNWFIAAEFTALDPVPYDSTTDERLY